MNRSLQSPFGSTGTRALITSVAALICTLNLGAQTTTATVHGHVRAGKGGKVIAGAVITATNNTSGYVAKAVSRPDGSYSLNLDPASYRVSVSAAGFAGMKANFRVQVGQVLESDFNLASEAGAAAVVEVTGALVEMQSPEVATNIATEQIENLPQGNRNFLNFAVLAPGIKLSKDEQNQSFSGGGQGAERVNIFIDGASFKNDVLTGGVAGQNSSRGNPFPLAAVQEFRVMTENYKAEYQKASGAVISAVTKSGGNEFHGDAFVYYQDKGLVANNYFAEKRGIAKPTYTRWQEGLSVGGPIIQDKMHFFLSYEGNRQNRDNQVYLGGNTQIDKVPSSLMNELKGAQGTFDAPFKSDLIFGKIDYQIDPSQMLEFNLNLRNEKETRDFGAQTSLQNATDYKNKVSMLSAKHKITSGNWLNEAMLSFQRYEWNPKPTNPDQVGRNYEGLMIVGGHQDEQDFVQKRTSLRDDFSYNGYANHRIKLGVNLDFLKYDVHKFQGGNPMFTFQTSVDPTLAMPSFALYGVGNPDLSASNQQYGWYVQDDWNVTPNLVLNLGLRWDFESDMYNKDYVTPSKVVSDLAMLKLPSKYFTDGHQRKADYSAFQPRIGFSYDLGGRGETVFFGGLGRYYDRETFNNILDERYRLQYAVRTFYFSKDGQPRNGQATLKWDPSYLSKAGLNGLIASGIAPNPEVYLLNNDSKAPYSDQISFGVRQKFGSVNTSITFTDVRSHNSLTWIWGNRDANLNAINVPGYSNVLISDTKRTWYDAMYVTIDKPYSDASGWGAGMTYTLSSAKQTGNDLFSLDFINADAFGKHPTNDDERHRLVANGMVRLPWDFRLSGVITLGSGTPYTIWDVTNGWGYNERHFYYNAGRPKKYSFIIPDFWAYRSVDVKIQKDFKIGKTRLGFNAEAINIFNYNNFTYGWDSGYIDANSAASGKFGQPVDALIGRRLQFGMTFTF